MATLHDKLKALGPVPFASLPSEQEDLRKYLQEHFEAAQFIIESIPQPAAIPTTSERRARATSSASTLSDISHSEARSETPSSEHEKLQKDWGRPIKLSEKENPVGVSVYKLSAKDGKGAWFARRSVHEGLSFDRWKEGLMQEFPTSLAVEGGPGSGKIRGIAADTRAVQLSVEDSGKMEVYYLSAQFPGPSAPRDFVTLLLTSDSALGKDGPRHYMVISKPCEHPDFPAKSGLVRGNYESVEFIREIPRSKKAASVTNLVPADGAAKDDSAISSEDTPSGPSGRSRGKTISFAESRGTAAKGESIDLRNGEESATDEDSHPVEWIMISRSDPGGSVPRFLVERGTPAGIAGDASKFLEWACKREMPAGLDGNIGSFESAQQPESDGAPDTQPDSLALPSGMISAAANAAYSTAETLAPNVTNSVLNAVSNTVLETSHTADETTIRSRSSSVSSDSFASAEEDFSDAGSLPSVGGGSGKQLSEQEKELLRLANRKSALAEKLQQARESAVRDKDNPTDKELARVKKAHEKYDREVAKAEERYAKATKQIENRRRRDETREQERQEREIKREVEKREKAERKEREAREKAEKKEIEVRLKSEVEKYKKEAGELKVERDGLKESVRRLQAENTKLVTMMGKLEGGERLLRELKLGGSDGTQEAERDSEKS